jgi:hypothetical protein
MFAPPPNRAPRRNPKKGSCEVTGPHLRSSANWMGIAAKHLIMLVIEVKNGLQNVQIENSVDKRGVQCNQEAYRCREKTKGGHKELICQQSHTNIPLLMASMQCPISRFMAQTTSFSDQ